MRWKPPAFTKNFFFITGIVFLMWMLFFDTNDLVSQYQLRKKVRDLEDKKEYFTEKIEAVNKDRRELMSNPQLLEKFAREKYLMKRQGEEVFIVVGEDGEPEGESKK
jgi:cell division protein FtsB